MMTNQIAEEIVSRVRNGDREAYRGIVSMYYDELLANAHYRIPSQALAEEVVQTVFIRAYTRLGQYEMGRDFGVWIRAIERFTILEELKKGERMEKNKKRYVDRIKDCMIVDAPSRQAAEIRDGMREALDNCMEALPDHSKALILERYRSGRTVRELADFFGRTITWVTTTLYRIHRRLGECITERLAAQGV
jgi:RNA polymerase sigma-70 factor (ECF subfamily)